MKRNVKKIAALLCALVLLTAAFAPAVQALDMFSSFGDLMGSDFGDILSSLLSGAGGNTGLSLNDILTNSNVMEALSERLRNLGINATNSEIGDALVALIQNSDMSDLSSLLNSNDFINQLATYLQNNPTTTEAPTTEPTTEEPTTEEPTTEAPTTEPTTAYVPQIITPTTTNIYQGADPYTVTNATTTEPSVYYPGSTEPSYTSPATTVAFTPAYTDEKGTVNESNNTLKLVIGFALLSAAAVAIIVVLMKMKKTNA